MACGIAQYEFAILVTATVLLILLGFAGVQKFIDRYNKEMVYRITICNKLELKEEIEKNIKKFKLRPQWLSHTKMNEELIIEYEISGAENNHDMLINYLTLSEDVINFHV
jgi:uncharacterized membrane protein YhiD involved in acid resistance